METIDKLDIQNLSAKKIALLAKEGYSIDSIIEQYKEYIFEKHKDKSNAIKWACYAGTLEALLSLTLLSLGNDTRF